MVKAAGFPIEASRIVSQQLSCLLSGYEISQYTCREGQGGPEGGEGNGRQPRVANAAARGPGARGAETPQQCRREERATQGFEKETLSV